MRIREDFLLLDQGMLDIWIHLAKDFLKFASVVGFFLNESGILFHRRIACAGKEFENVARRHFSGLSSPCESDRVL